MLAQPHRNQPSDHACSTQQRTLALCLLLCSLVALAPQLDSISYQSHEQAFNRSLATLAIAKTLNGVISLLQGTEIEGSLVFASATFSLGEILDPLNDLIERFSWIMLASTIALGIERLLIDLGGAPALKVAIGLLGLAGLALTWTTRLALVRTLILRVLGIVLILRLTMPILEGCNSLVYIHYTSPLYSQAALSLNQATGDLSALKENFQAPKELSFFESLAKRLEETSEEMVTMMVIFVLHSIIIPLFILWAALRTISHLLFGPGRGQRLLP